MKHAGHIAAVAASLAVASATARAGQAAFDDYNTLEDWSAAVGGIEAITFTDLEPGDFVLDSYAHLGVETFQFDDVVYNPQFGFEDGMGVWGGSVDFSVDMQFESPVTAVAVDQPGDIYPRFFLDGELVLETGGYSNGWSGYEAFVGWTLDTPFDYVEFRSPGGAYIDNIYVPTIVPAPAGLAVFAGLLVTRRRRRT